MILLVRGATTTTSDVTVMRSILQLALKGFKIQLKYIMLKKKRDLFYSQRVQTLMTTNS